MDFNFKKAAAGASSFLSRAKQLTEEKLGGAEKTEYDANFEQLLKNADHTRALTERIISNCEALLQPNPNERLEDFLLTKLDKKTSKPNNLEIYGYCMVEAGSEIGFNSQYGNVLVKVGEAEKKLGFAEKEYVQKATDSFLQPLKSFLDGQMKIIQKEKKSLETKRIDLDICKSKMKRHKDGKADEIQKDEEELRKAQTEFDRQLELTKLLLDELHVTHNHHLRCLSDFVDAQLTYHNKSVKILQDLQKQIGGITMQFNSNKITINNNVNTNNNITNPNFNYNNNNNNSKLNSITANTTNLSINSNDNNNNNNKNNLKKAKVLFDYEASEPSELSVFANEIVYVEISAEDNDWVCAKRDNNLNNNNVLNDTYCGKIPKAYIQIVE